MKRSELTVGARAAHSRDNDWASSPYRIHEVTVVDTRGWSARRSSFAARQAPEVELQDGTKTNLFLEDSSKPTALVRNTRGQLDLVPLAQLRGDYLDCLNIAVNNQKAQRERADRVEAAKQEARQRVTAAAEQLKALGVNVGHVSGYDEQIKLGPAALEQILEMLAAK